MGLLWRTCLLPCLVKAAAGKTARSTRSRTQHTLQLFVCSPPTLAPFDNYSPCRRFGALALPVGSFLLLQKGKGLRWEDCLTEQLPPAIKVGMAGSSS